jgi:hypothetical protein
MSHKKLNVNAKLFVAGGGRIHVIYTGELSHRMVGADVNALDGQDLELADRVLVLAQNEQGYAGCVITPEPDERCTETPSSVTSSSGSKNMHMFAAMNAAVGYDKDVAVVAMRACRLDEEYEPCESRSYQKVKAAGRTAIARLELYGPIETSFNTPLEITFHALSGVDHDQVILHGDRPRTTRPPRTPVTHTRKHTPDFGDAAIDLATCNYPGHAGTKNDTEELFALLFWFTEEVGGRIVDYNTARSGIPVGTKADGHRRRVIVAICPDGLAGASVWHVPNDLVAFEGLVKRARREMLKAGVEGLIDENYEPSYLPFDQLRNTGTAIRRALKSPFQTMVNASQKDIVAQVLGKEARKPCLRGPRRQTSLVIKASKMSRKDKADNPKFGKISKSRA